jgi:hypothetical protein
MVWRSMAVWVGCFGNAKRLLGFASYRWTDGVRDTRYGYCHGLRAYLLFVCSILMNGVYTLQVLFSCEKSLSL